MAVAEAETRSVGNRESGIGRPRDASRGASDIPGLSIAYPLIPIFRSRFSIPDSRFPNKLTGTIDRSVANAMRDNGYDLRDYAQKTGKR